MTDETTNIEQTDPPTPAYDPSAHTAAEVIDYLASADADEVARVQADEAAGKDRSTIADWTSPEPDPEDTVTLKVTLPFWTDSFSMQKDPADSGNGQYVVTRAGTEVPADVAEQIITRALASGVTVVEED
jgi:hypothetical protein